MARRVLDTNVVSYLWKGHSLKQAYQAHAQGRQIYLSFMTFAELREGAVRANWKQQRWNRLLRFMSPWNIVDSTVQLCMRWADLRSERRQQPISVPDAWIAATVLDLNCELVTHNPRDFAGIAGLKFITEAAS